MRRKRVELVHLCVGFALGGRELVENRAQMLDTSPMLGLDQLAHRALARIDRELVAHAIERTDDAVGSDDFVAGQSSRVGARELIPLDEPFGEEVL